MKDLLKCFFIYLFTEKFLSYYMSGPIPGAGDIAVNQRDKNACLHEVSVLVEGRGNRGQIIK